MNLIELLLFQFLLQSIVSDRQAVNMVINYLQNFSPIHLTSIIQKSNIYTPLFRLLFIKQHCSENSITLARNLLLYINIKNPVVSILQQFLSETADIKPKQIVTETEQHMKDISYSDTADLGVKLGQQLLQNSAEPEKTGLLVDWLSAVELEIVNLKNKQVQVSLQFSPSFKRNCNYCCYIHRWN